MNVEKEFGLLASLLAAPVRAIMLWNLLDGKAFTATELAIASDVSAQSASMHLNKLVQADLLKVESQGRHRYYRFARPEVAYAIEAMANLVPHREKNRPEQPIGGVKYCRTCYDHLAGKVAVDITDQLLKQKMMTVTGQQYLITPKGVKLFSGLGIRVGDLKEQRRTFARPCLDWSERRHHMAGTLGAALLNRMLALGWVRKVKNSRETIVTQKGQIEFNRLLGLNV